MMHSNPTFLADFTHESSSSDSEETFVLCTRCKAEVTIADPKRQNHLQPLSTKMKVLAEQQDSAFISNNQVLGASSGVFGRLGPQNVEQNPPVRRRLNFDKSFYDDDYFARRSATSSSSIPRTFKPPEPRGQQWHGYNLPARAYTVLSKSQKRRQQRNGCNARLRT